MHQPSPLARLWAHAQHALSALCVALPPLDTLLTGERRKLRTWLRALESFCRRLALTEALALPRSNEPPRPTQKRSNTATNKRRPNLRLWPHAKPAPPRIRLLGAATSVRELQDARRRAALIARLAHAQRKPAHLRLADRIEALQRFLGAPARAIRCFARKLRQAPRLALALVAQRMPASPYLAPENVRACESLSYAAALDNT